MSKILVVDDEPGIVELLKSRLEREGFSVVTAIDGKQALAKVLESKPDLILLDVSMAGMNGFEILKHLKGASKTRLIPVFMLTGRTALEDLDEGIREYADKYITKPIDFKYLFEEIRKTLLLLGL